jgi:hypothetical protein
VNEHWLWIWIWIWKIGEVLAGVGVGVLIWLLTDRDPKTLVAPLSMGILLALGFEVFRTDFWLEEKFQEADKKVETLDARSSEIVLALARGAGDLKTIARAWVNKQIPRDEMPRVWRELSWAMLKKYRSITFMRSEEMYDRGFSNAVMTIQGAKVVGGDVSVAKVIIFQDPQELENENMKKIIEHHHDVGITIKFIAEQKIRESFLNDKLAKLDSLQFALFDDEVAFVWILNDKRELISGRVFVDSDEYKKYSEFYDELERTASQRPPDSG